MTEPYILLRAALALFKKPPTDLADSELQQAKRQADNEHRIENKVLSSTEAIGVVVSETELKQAYQEIRSRYTDEGDFLNALEKNQLNENSLRAAIQRQCQVNTVLERVASRATPVTDVDIELYYRLHPEKFSLPERRSVSHIFISINPDYPENTRLAALQRANELQAKLHKKPYKFADLALKHSECPTALQGGDLGTVARGKLYPELDAVLFKLKAGEISHVVESEIGWHILLCKHVYKAETISLNQASAKIRSFMEDRAKQDCIRAWLANLS